MMQATIDNTTKQLFDEHREALVIFIDKDEQNEGEFTLGAFNKTRDDGLLMSLLMSILESLINVHSQECSGQTPSETPADKEKDCSKSSENNKVGATKQANKS
jgi:hypothetical protein